MSLERNIADIAASANAMRNTLQEIRQLIHNQRCNETVRSCDYGNHTIGARKADTRNQILVLMHDAEAVRNTVSIEFIFCPMCGQNLSKEK